MAKKEKPQVRRLDDIVNNTADRAKLQNLLDEAVQCKVKIADQNESIKGIREDAFEAVGISPKMFNQLLGIWYNRNFEEKQEELNSLDSAIQLMAGISQGE